MGKIIGHYIENDLKGNKNYFEFVRVQVIESQL